MFQLGQIARFPFIKKTNKPQTPRPQKTKSFAIL